MDDAKKLQFIAGMTAHALQHVASTPNIQSADGKMSHDKKLAFVQAMTKHGLEHLDAGGVAGPTTIGAPAATVNNSGPVGAIGKALGLNNQFQAGSAQIQAGTNAGQLNQAYEGAQSGLNQQQNVADILSPGVSQAANNQSTLAQMELNQANGVGPNPAQNQYNQNINNIAAQQAGAIASTKGLSPALKAREIAQEAGAAGQNAAGQAATLQAQQQLAAENNLQNLSATQASQGAQAVQGVNNTQQNEQNILQGANTAYNNAGVGMQTNLNNVNAQTAIANQNQASNIFSGIGNLASSIPIVGSLFAEGGKVKKPTSVYDAKPKMMDAGGLVTTPTSGPQSYVGQWLNSTQNLQGPSIAATPTLDTNIKDPFKKKDKGGVPSIPGANPGMGIAGGGDMSAVTAGGAADAGGLSDLASVALLAAKGGTVKAANKNQKAQVDGDSLKNDKIPALLSEGEVVMDKDTLADPGPVGQMARAVAAHIAKRNKSKGKK